MKPAPFEYVAPLELHDAIELLAERADDAKVLAGGQSLVPLLNFRLARPTVLVDLNRIRSLAYVERTDDGGLRIGAVTRQRALETNGRSDTANPLLVEAIANIGHFQIRNRGTIGGSIAHADPSAELPAVLTALGGSVIVAGRGGTREIPASELFIGPLMTSLEPDEILTEVRLPKWDAADGWAVIEVSRRRGDFALLGAACRLALGPDGLVTDARAALFGAGPTPVLVASASDLVGTRCTTEDLRAVGAAAAEAIEPSSDIHATAAYRKQITPVLVQRAFERAYERASEDRNA